MNYSENSLQGYYSCHFQRTDYQPYHTLVFDFNRESQQFLSRTFLTFCNKAQFSVPHISS